MFFVRNVLGFNLIQILHILKKTLFIYFKSHFSKKNYITPLKKCCTFSLLFCVKSTWFVRYFFYLQISFSSIFVLVNPDSIDEQLRIKAIFELLIACAKSTHFRILTTLSGSGFIVPLTWKRKKVQ